MAILVGEGRSIWITQLTSRQLQAAVDLGLGLDPEKGWVGPATALSTKEQDLQQALKEANELLEAIDAEVTRITQRANV